MTLAAYDPKAIQERSAGRWAEAGGFRAEAPKPGQAAYSLVMPPPNVTGVLHLGHALNNTLQDVLIRWRRMKGDAALWLAGADHAGIATQAVVEKRLKEQENKTRHDVGREALVERIWAWANQCEGRIKEQLTGIGSSYDDRRWRFTLDETCTRAVRHAFFRLFQAGHLFRGQRLVNWDVQLQTAVADDELDKREVDGSLWRLRYPVEGTAEFLDIDTTRPETMLGDTAVAVHPDDPRYRHLHGKMVRLPLMDRLIPVVADGMVERDFGTGVVKVTPAHDPNDYACGERHGLPRINILEPDGRINAAGGKYAGLPREKARKAVVADLEALGLLVQTTPHRHMVPHSDRSKTPIEPYLSDQWFVRMADLAEPALAAVRSGEIKFHPERYQEMYLRWLGEKRDWCVSRQLWWGHRIPVWYFPGGADGAKVSATAAFLHGLHAEQPAKVSFRRDDANAYACLLDDDPALAKALEDRGLVRDPDVLDTWFSSALWPLSTLGWPAETPDLAAFHPTSVLSTAREIITLWVARMVVLSEFLVGRIPFRNVYVHAVIMDGDGRKMSKSLGNGVDPFDIIDKYGADALRFTLVHMATETQDVRMPATKEKLPDGREVNVSAKFELGRNFGTKIYNAAKLVLTNLEGYVPAAAKPEDLADEDRWILHRLNEAVRAADAALSAYQFSEYGRVLYEFVWGELCDWWLEMAKPRFRGDGPAKATAQGVAAAVLDRTLRLLQPVMPFVAEELWQAFAIAAPRRGIPNPQAAEPLLLTAAWPEPLPEHAFPAVAARVAALQDVLRAFRTLRSQFNLPPKDDFPALVQCDAELAGYLAGCGDAAKQLAKASPWQCGPDVAKPPRAIAAVLPFAKVFLPLGDGIDLEAEIAKQRKKRDELQRRRDGAAAKLADETFRARAKPEVVEQQLAAQADSDRQIAALDAILRDLAG